MLEYKPRFPQNFHPGIGIISGAHNLRSLQMTLAACASAEQDGAPVAIQ